MTQYISDYIGFATQDGTVQDGATYLLLGGPVLIALLLVYIAYNAAAIVAGTVRRTARFVSGRTATATATDTVPVAPARAVTAATTTTPTVAGEAYALPSQRRPAAKVG